MRKVKVMDLQTGETRTVVVKSKNLAREQTIANIENMIYGKFWYLLGGGIVAIFIVKRLKGN